MTPRSTADPASSVGNLPLLEVKGLHAGIDGGDKEILQGIDITVAPGQVVVIMGPNGSGKSTLGHVLMGRPGYTVTGGTAYLGGQDLLAMETYQRAQAGLFLAHQHPIEVPGVPLDRALRRALSAKAASEVSAPANTSEDAGRHDAAMNVMAGEADQLGLEPRFLDWPLNVDMSGGEKKRNEMLQIGVLRPRIAILDEIDSGLDVDGLRIVARRLVAATKEWGMGVLAITHFNRLLTELPADVVHVLAHGQIVDSGGPELALTLEDSGYVRYE